jgi:hypothetical protein
LGNALKIIKFCFLALLVNVTGCAQQAVVSPAVSKQAPAPAPSPAPVAVASGDLVTQSQTVGLTAPQAHAYDGVDLRIISMGVVEYPEEARHALISGRVVILAYVGKDGVPYKCAVESQSFVQNVRDSAGNIVPNGPVDSLARKDGSVVSLADLFDPLAIKAMMQARFAPRRQFGVAVRSIGRMPVVFGVAK